MITIKLIDNGSDRYILKSDNNVLGRRYDNNSESIIVEKPSAEVGSLCEMFVTYNGSLVDVIQVDNEPISVTSNLSQYPAVKIGFSFSRADGYVKNSEPKMFTFLDAIKPEDFTPSEPEGQRKINQIVAKGFVDVQWAENGHNTLEFLNIDGNVSKTIELSGFVQEQSDLAETDNQKETFVKGKSTKNLLNEGEDGSSPYATEQFVLDNAGGVTQEYVDNAVNAEATARETADNNLQSQINEKANISSVPTKTSDLTNDSGFTTETYVDNAISSAITTALNTEV